MTEKKLKNKLYEIIFESDTRAGKVFDLILIFIIILSVLTVLLDSVKHYSNLYGKSIFLFEWFFTIIFTIEYFLRIYCIKKPIIYVKSFYGIIDFLSIVPTYISIFLPASRYLSVIRILRVLRIFRILKLIMYIGEANLLMQALYSSRRKIIVFLFSILTMVTILGSIMYLIEGEANGFTSIPRSIYWAIVTITTVGYGDISPQTGLGQVFASIAMILGYATIAVPTGIISAEYSTMKASTKQIICTKCNHSNHESDSKYCKLCGNQLFKS